jgi:hypothetical protein
MNQKQDDIGQKLWPISKTQKLLVPHMTGSVKSWGTVGGE